MISGYGRRGDYDLKIAIAHERHAYHDAILTFETF